MQGLAEPPATSVVQSRSGPATGERAGNQSRARATRPRRRQDNHVTCVRRRAEAEAAGRPRRARRLAHGSAPSMLSRVGCLAVLPYPQPCRMRSDLAPQLRSASRRLTTRRDETPYTLLQRCSPQPAAALPFASPLRRGSSCSCSCSPRPLPLASSRACVDKGILLSAPVIRSSHEPPDA